MIPKRIAESASMLVMALCIVGCESKADQPKLAPKARNQAVLGGPTPEPEAPKEPAEATPAPPSATAPRKLCVSGAPALGKAVSGEGLEVRSRAGARVPRPQPAVGAGAWTWVNFWAAWCKPCKEEIPMLEQWVARLREEGVSIELLFISLDDDARQLDRFLSQPGEGGLEATYWLSDGPKRGEWLDAIGMSADPELPAHLLVGPDGRVKCAIQGAVEAGDYAQIARLVGSG